jgi:hypothetical protein
VARPFGRDAPFKPAAPATMATRFFRRPGATLSPAAGAAAGLVGVAATVDPPAAGAFN